MGDNNAVCACLNIKYDPIHTPDGFARERWVCAECGTIFVKKAEVERLRSNFDALKERASGCDYEIEQLRSDLASANSGRSLYLKALTEVVNAVAEVAGETGENPGWEPCLERIKAEVERLRADIATAHREYTVCDAERDQLRSDNFDLSARQCLFTFGCGLTSDEGGSQFCQKEEELKAAVKAIGEEARLRGQAEADRDELVEALRSYSGDDECQTYETDKPMGDCGCRWCKSQSLIDRLGRR